MKKLFIHIPCIALSALLDGERCGRCSTQRAERGGTGVLVCACLQTLTKMPAKSGLRAAIRPAARARYGRANDTDGLWE
eukprot:gene23162-biopygen11806